MSKILGFGCLVVVIIMAFVFFGLLSEFLPPNAFWGVVTIVVAAGLIFFGVASAADWGVGTDSAVTGCLIPVIAVGGSYFVLSVLLGWSFTAIAIVTLSLLILGFLVFMVVSDPPDW